MFSNKARAAALAALCLLAGGCATPGKPPARVQRGLATAPPLPPWKFPSASEQRLFHLLFRRFEHYAGAVPAEAPVADALATLKGAVVIDLGCSSATISTRLMAWQQREPTDGRYEWGGIEGTDTVDRAGRRRLRFINVVALNAESLELRESRGRREKVEHVGLFYHEMLHAQLLIDAMRRDEAWRRAYCENRSVDFGPADMGLPHRRINGLEEKFIESLWDTANDLRVPF